VTDMELELETARLYAIIDALAALQRARERFARTRNTESQQAYWRRQIDSALDNLTKNHSTAGSFVALSGSGSSLREERKPDPVERGYFTEAPNRHQKD
jgi:hypothetical protein